MEWQLFEPGTVPEYTTPEWYAGREHAPHLEQEPHRSRLIVTAQMVNSLPIRITRVVDLGAGDGGLLSQLEPRFSRMGFDLQATNVKYGSDVRRVPLAVHDVVADFPNRWFDLQGKERCAAVATEMLEHLVDPHRFVRTIGRHARYLVASSPYKETGDSHYAFHTWAWDLDGYRTLLAQGGYTTIKTVTVDIFQVVLAEQMEE